MADDKETRRDFLGLATCALAGCAGIAAIAPALVAIASPLDGGIVTLGEGLVDVGPLAAFEPGVPRRVAIRAARTDAFLKEGERSLGSVLVVRSSTEIVVFSATCPHAGCEIGLREGALACPCHESRFGLKGERQAGPSPRDLDRLEAKVENGRVLVKFVRFAVGTSEKRVV